MTETADRLRELLAGATPLPWEKGERVRTAYEASDLFGEGWCAYCGEYPKVGEFFKTLPAGQYRYTRERGSHVSSVETSVKVHLHEAPSEDCWPDGIRHNPPDATPVVVVEQEDDEWGKTTTDADAELIVAAVNALPGLLDVIEKVQELAEQWRYKGEFGWGPWQSGEGPDESGEAMDKCASQLREALGPWGATR